MHSILYGTPGFWRLNLCAWFLFGGVEFLLRYLIFGDLHKAFVFTLVHEPLSFILSGAMHSVYRRPFMEDFFRMRTVLLVLLLSVAGAMLHAEIALLMLEVLGWHNPFWTLREEWVLRTIYFSFIYLVWSLLYYALKARLRARRNLELARSAQEQSQKLELGLLRSQLNPHFLFNALNGIATEIPSEPERATGMLHALSRYLRHTLDHRHDDIRPLDAELSALESFLEIERARFGDAFFADIQVDDDARRIPVPGLLLQPLVENALKFGASEERREMHLSIRMDEQVLCVEVRNRGVLQPEDMRREGVGLETLRRILHIHYPQQSEFSLRQDGSEVVALLRLKGIPCSALP